MKHFSLFFLLAVLTLPGIGQQGYYRTDSTTFVGIELKNTGITNSYFCSVKKGDDIVEYSPYEICEYGFKQGLVFKSFNFDFDGKSERYFAEQIVKGTISLYNLRLKGGINQYYILSGDSADLREVHLTRSEVRDMLAPLVDTCSQAASNLHYLKPNKYSLTRYLNYLNSCSAYPYPKFHYGIKLGIAGTQFYPVDRNSDFAKSDFNSDISLTVGAFLDMPLFSNNVSFAPEIYFKGNHYSNSFNNAYGGFDIALNYSSLNFPLLLKYRFVREGIIPFLQLGPVYSRLVKNKAILYNYDISDNDIFIEIDDTPVIQKNMGGFSIGGGILALPGKRYTWFGELRYNYLYNLGSEEKYFDLGEFSIHTGLLF